MVFTLRNAFELTIDDGLKYNLSLEVFNFIEFDDLIAVRTVLSNLQTFNKAKSTELVVTGCHDSKVGVNFSETNRTVAFLIHFLANLR